ncbi:class I SAM-dependent methyltransferase [Sphingomonas montanisoli]|uniref:Class I SAM-dependent methyltransferase n=1 Tax=Sphingomonas montanisoli TaxID=2606412 RepID=A0A5D9CB43_9SPHN|nr:class I SAM-dependent methyltransferase [Sphingomonas montanisoli]TZG29178.1 class I SAM-dependent methyltransferase [Sphingomonas montanisoli]
MRHLLLAAAALAAVPAITIAAKPLSNPGILTAVADPQRSEADRARDKYRHPVETLEFFGIQPTQTVIEYQPGGGWFTAILAPMLREKGSYIAMPSERGAASFKTLAEKNVGFWGPITAYSFSNTAPSTIPAGTADRVVTFRNVHNMIMAGEPVAAKAFGDFYAALKSGGILGVEDHRLPEEKDSALEKSSGYIKKSTVIRLATAAGFKLVGESKVNANPKDTHDWPEGVWTLPPTYKLGDKDRAKYQAIGESDRFLLKFVKP